MATVKHKITEADGWVEVAATGTDFLIEAVGPKSARVTLQAAAPGADAPFHTLRVGQAMVRVGTGAVYVSPTPGGDTTVVVTT